MNVFGLWEEAVVPRKNPHGRGENMLMLTPPRKGNSRPEASCSKVTTPPKKIKTCTDQLNLFVLLLQLSDVERWCCNNSRPLWRTSAAFILSIRDLWRIIMRSSDHISSWLSVETCTLLSVLSVCLEWLNSIQHCCSMSWNSFNVMYGIWSQMRHKSILEIFL